MTLTERIQQPDLIDLPDWMVAQILNTPDDALPPKVWIEKTVLDPQDIMVVLGGDAGAAFLDNLENLANQIPKIKWALFLIKNKGLDVSLHEVRAALDDFILQGILTTNQVFNLKNQAVRTQKLSWAQYNNIEVTPRTVGLARGAI